MSDHLSTPSAAGVEPTMADVPAVSSETGAVDAAVLAEAPPTRVSQSDAKANRKAESQAAKVKAAKAKVDKPPKVKRGVWRAVVLAGAVVGAGAFAGGYALAPDPVPDWAETVELAGTPIEVTEREYTGDRRANAEIRVSEEHQLVAPMGGVVRASFCEPEQSFRSGNVAATINNTPVIGFYSDPPMWRDLGSGVRGDDVSALQTELARLGYFTAEPNGVFGASTGIAVRALWREIGPANSTQQTFPMSQIMWMDAPSSIITERHVEVGDTVAPGDPILTLGGSLEALQVDLLGLEDPSTLIVTAVGLQDASGAPITTPLPADGLITDRTFLDAFTRLHMFQQARIDGNPVVSVTTRLAEALQLTAVPPSSLYEQVGREACLLVDGVPTPVTVMGSELGQSLVSSDEPIRSVILAPVDPAPCR